MWSGIVWPAETHLADALKMHSQLWDFESIILAEPKERRSERWLWKAHTNSRRDGADGSLNFFVPPQPFPILRDVFYSHFAGGISSGVITEWEDLPKMAGEDSRIWKGWFRIPNPPSRWWSVLVWLNQPLFIRSCITCLLFHHYKRNRFFIPSHTAKLWKEHSLGWAYLTHVMIVYFVTG